MILNQRVIKNGLESIRMYNKKELIKDFILIIVLITIALSCYNLT